MDLQRIDKLLLDFKNSAWIKQNNDWLENQYRFFNTFFDKNNLSKIEWSNVQELGTKINAFNSMPLAKARALGNPNAEIQEYRDAFLYLIYGQDSDENKIQAFTHGEYSLFGFGENVTSELVAYAFPDKYVLYNSRDKEAVEFLGIDLEFERGDNFGSKFIKYNKAIEPLIRRYEELIGLQTKTTIKLEVDQFFSYLYENIIDRENDITTVLLNFLKQSKTTDLKTSSYPKEYNSLGVKVGFGMGTPAGVTWMAFTAKDMEVSNGIYPCYLYYKDLNILVLSYGISETNKSNKLWSEKIVKSHQTISNYFNNKSIKYKDSLVFKVYKINFTGDDVKLSYENDNENLNKETVNTDLKNIIDKYKKLIGQNQNYWLISPGEKASLWQEFYSNGIIGIGWDALKSLSHFKDKDDIVNKMIDIYGGTGSKKNNATSCWNFFKDMAIGDYIFVKDGTRKIIGYGRVTSNYKFDDSRKEYKHIRSVNWLKKGEWILSEENTNKLVIKTLTDITKNRDLINSILSLIGVNNILESNKLILQKNMFTQPLNQILYGPPGTGKTYETLKLAEKLLSAQVKQETKEEKLRKLFIGSTWNDIIGLVLLKSDKPMKVSEISNDEYIQIFSQLKNNKNIIPTIWKRLQDDADNESTNIATRNGNDFVHKDKHSFWTLTSAGKEYYSNNSFKIKLSAIKNNAATLKDWHDYYEFITFHQSYSYEEFIEGIRPVLDSENIKYELKDGVFKRICLKAKLDPENKYLLIIDEINRGNMSKIFGELITLIEEDKRDGAANQLIVTLPYSDEKFSVPNNLYIIGTMNTADRSIALLDIALRRRFNFQEMKPKSDLVNVLSEINLSKLLDTLNKKIEVIIDRDHLLGHSYFMKAKNPELLYQVWYHEIIPLLEEYFYNDYEKLKQILGKYRNGIGFIEMTDIEKIFEGEDINDYSESETGHIHKYENPDELIKALKALYE
ncbi:MAG: AAA family ATPase [Candidatus Cloacimonetes bacterium]|nr:AAA family ATPase [Candidatus Cloacimonadota bacterium]